jgi:hypothetical protein
MKKTIPFCAAILVYLISQLSGAQTRDVWSHLLKAMYGLFPAPEQPTSAMRCPHFVQRTTT